MIDGSVPDAEMDAFDRRCVPSGTELYNQTPAGSGIAAVIVMGVLRSPPSTATLPALG